MEAVPLHLHGRSAWCDAAAGERRVQSLATFECLGRLRCACLRCPLRFREYAKLSCECPSQTSRRTSAGAPRDVDVELLLWRPTWVPAKSKPSPSVVCLRGRGCGGGRLDGPLTQLLSPDGPLSINRPLSNPRHPTEEKHIKNGPSEGQRAYLHVQNVTPDGGGKSGPGSGDNLRFQRQSLERHPVADPAAPLKLRR